MARHTKVPMSSVTALTLRADRKTTGRRSSPVPQLSCKGKLCRQYEPEVVQCRAMGSDWSGTQWSCTADLPSQIKMGSVEVSCEGWDNSADSNILAGSCALEYNLVPSGAAYERNNYPDRMGPSSSPFDNVASLFTYLMLGWAIWTVLKNVLPRVAAWWRGQPGAGRGGGSGGGRGGSHRPGFGGGPAGGGPPPPYKAYADPHQPQAQAGAAGGGSTWRSMAAGAAAALAAQQAASYLTGGRQRGGYNGGQQEYDWQRRRGYGGRSSLFESSDDWDRGIGGSGTRFGGGGGGFGGGSGGGMRESTGFGGTRNR